MNFSSSVKVGIFRSNSLKFIIIDLIIMLRNLGLKDEFFEYRWSHSFYEQLLEIHNY